jgi:D-sedoheptulose 7-phosphate isomerase
MMPIPITEHFKQHQRVVELSLEKLQPAAEEVGQALVKALKEGNKVIAFGNGGSATQASHLVGELIGRFAVTRQPFPAIALAGDAGTVTCIGNDFGFEALFERQIQALAQPGDVAIGFTTSGRSENVRRGLAMAQQRGAISVAVTGAKGLIDGKADYVVAVPSDSTAHIQEVHLMLLHVWCIYIDEMLGTVIS